MKKLIVQENDANQRIDKYLKKILENAPSSLIYKMLRKKDIKVNGSRINEKYIVQLNDEVSLFLHEDKFLEYTKQKEVKDIEISFEVLYEDDQILVVNKSAGLLVHEDINESLNTLSNQVLAYLNKKGELDLSRENSFMPGPVHRLDRNTSGIVIFGKTLDALQTLNEMVKQRHCIDKEYCTIVKGYLKQEALLEDYIVKIKDESRVKLVNKDTPGALSMKTIIKPAKSNYEYTEVFVKLITGRTHQIRIHLSSIGHPIIGDRKYGDFQLNRELTKTLQLSHQLLHAYSITFVKPFGKLSYLQDKKIICPVPKMYQNIKIKLL
ncbi:RluA family pseudouridine synthase [Tannockella kyphosi]|uniref:RluA family pseudouridine synthase n=1 Tax=Tannockella kyphosi TaxID=2899121 RepID=UPI0020127943|nr:RluA family pseudouridine synthase [Tannockella kyphosi]